MKESWKEFKELEKEARGFNKKIMKNPWYWIICGGISILSFTPYLAIVVKEHIEDRRLFKKQYDKRTV